MCGGHPEGDPRGRDLALRAHEPLRHGRLGDEEGTSDLSRAEPAEGAQDEGDLSVEAQRRVGAGEDQLEAFVGERLALLRFVVHGLGHLQHAPPRGEGALATDPVDCPVAGGHDQPGAGVRGLAVSRPTLRGDREGLLGGLLGEVEIAEVADQGGEHPAPLFAEQLLAQRGTSGRTSTAPPIRAAGIRAASSIAASRSLASSM